MKLSKEEETISKKELDLVLLIQDYKRFIVSQNAFHNTNIDWYKRTLAYYNSIDKEILKELGLSHNRNSFEYVLNFKVTDELLNAELK